MNFSLKISPFFPPGTWTIPENCLYEIFTAYNDVNCSNI